MRAIFGLVLALGVALAGFAVYMAQGYIGQSEARLSAALELQRATGKLVQVYALVKPVKYGDPISKENVRKVWLQEQFLPTGTFSDEAVLFPPNNERQRFAMRSIEANEILLASRVTEPGQVAGLAGKLDPGMSAFQVRVSTATGVSGFVMPDDYIDIYWTGASGNGEVTRLIESAVRVIAVDQSSDQSQYTARDAQTLTIAASKEQVARLAQAQATGRLAMSLVASSADAANGLVEIDRNALLGVEVKEAVQAEAAEVCTIRTRKGSEILEIPIPCTN
ncbi:Flp pilus assembly protein CpaB [Pseudogemmobacter humi]|uniref:Flp pilus assembly protein RcpC/CpaB domain-containing protein n=1 Tax=Pseudogemmobacter humi TaxID=2483812 RepID=A0A3P5XQP8_9RHOB|nr:Flp pilus assembly protein CpaB [Pseudogemmobacter humi]VDC32758.1 hypothetical protein XINFAN_03437 [Pseudogemmobacter humi]